MCEKNPDFRVGRYETRDKGGTAIGHWTKVLALGRPGVHGGARAGIALLPASRGPRSRVTLAFLWGRGAASFAGRKRPQPQPQHTRRDGRSNLYVPHKRPGSGRTRTASPGSAARSASSLRLERPSNDEAASPKENVAVTTSCLKESRNSDDAHDAERYGNFKWGGFEIISRSRWVRTAASEKVRPPRFRGVLASGIIIFEMGIRLTVDLLSLISSTYEITSSRLSGLQNFRSRPPSPFSCLGQ